MKKFLSLILLIILPTLTFAQFRDAIWIGTQQPVLFSQYLPVFRMNWTLQLDQDSKSTNASVLFGGNDPRLMDHNLNILGVEAKRNESFIRLELDATKLETDSVVNLKLWRVGYTTKGEELISTISLPEFLDDSILYLPHDYSVSCNLGNLDIYLDNKKIIHTGINPLQDGGDHIAFPVLGEIGWEMKAGQYAKLSNLEVRNFRSPNGILYSDTTAVFIAGEVKLMPEKKTKQKYVAATKKYKPKATKSRRRGRRADGERKPKKKKSTKSYASKKLSSASDSKSSSAEPIIEKRDVRCLKNISHGSMPILTTTFKLKEKKVASAMLNTSARGIYDLTINGLRLSSEYFAPGASQYNRTHYYQTYNIRQALRNKNYINDADTISVQLSEGWWAGAHTFSGENWNYYGDQLSFIARLVVRYEDGDSTVVVTDPSSWNVCTNGPVRYASMFQGEVYDNRITADSLRFTSADEMPLDRHIPQGRSGNEALVNDYSHFVFKPASTNVMPFSIIEAQSVTKVRDDVYIYDMGQNMAGVPHVIMRSELPAGKQITFRYAEVLYPDMERYGDNRGHMMLENIRAAMAQDIYISGKDSTANVFSPRGTLHGYRYLEITGIDHPLALTDVQGIILSSVGDFTAEYECSNPLVNRLWKNIQNSMLSNFISIPTDCPQRNERMGWSGDISVFSRTATNMADVDAFLRKHMQAMRDLQSADGRFPDIAPSGGGFGGFLWGSAGITVPWECWLQYGDKEILAEHYDAMKKYIDYVENHYIDHASGLLVQERQWGDLGDWLGLEDGKNDKTLLFESYYIYDLQIMLEAARILERKNDAERFEKRIGERKRFFVDTYIDKETGKTIASSFNKDNVGQTIDIQGSYVLPLALGIIENDTLRQKLVDNLVATIQRKNTTDQGIQCPEYSLMTGFITTAWISRVLSDNGRSDVAYRLLQQKTFPSWLYPVTQGATTIWERLNSYTDKDGFGDNNSMNSFNHYSFGAVGQWLINRSLGIERDDSKPGFKHFILRPEIDPTNEMKWAKGHLDTKYGRIESHWYYDHKGRLTYDFTVPSGTTATLILPGRKPKLLKSGHHTIRR